MNLFEKKLISAAFFGFAINTGLAADLRIGTMAYVPYSPALIAEKNGWVEEELNKLGVNGVKVTWRNFSGGPPVNEALASGNLDIGNYGDSPAIAGYASGINTQIVGYIFKGGAGQALFVLKDAPYKKVADLKGKKVATLRGANTHELLILMIEEAGLKISDIDFVSLKLEDMTSALIRGDVQAILAWDPVRTKIESENIARSIRDGSGLKSNFNPIVATKDIVKNNQNYITAYLNAVKRGAEYIKSNPQEAAKQLAPKFGLTEEQTQQAFSRSEFFPAIKPEDKAEFDRSVKFMLENRMIKKSFDVNDFFLKK